MNSVASPEEAAATIALLVSVRSLEELRLVADLAIDVLDFKEPHRGALAAADPELWRQAALQTQLTCRLSAALGEWDGAVELASSVPQQFAYAKAGPAGVQSIARLTASWAEIRARLAPEIELVAVAYADHEQADCPEPAAIFQAAAAAGMQTWLLDTFEKSARRDSITLLGTDRLAAIEQLAQRAGARWVLAGSVNRQAALELLQQGVQPTMFGVRGDVCEGSRGGQIVPRKVQRWLDGLRGAFAHEVNQGDDRRRAQAEA